MHASCLHEDSKSSLSVITSQIGMVHADGQQLGASNIGCCLRNLRHSAVKPYADSVSATGTKSKWT